jgi:hypothetical protein
MNGMDALVQMRPVINVVRYYDLALTTFDLDILDSVRKSCVGTNNIFFRERIGKVPPVLHIERVAISATVPHTKLGVHQLDNAFDNVSDGMNKGDRLGGGRQ